MRFSCLIAAFLAVFSLQAMAQDAAPPPADAAKAAPQSGVDDLIRLLENDEARNALLTRLKAQAAETPAEAEAKAAAVEAEEGEPTIARQVAEYTRAAAEQVAGAAGSLATGVAGLAEAFTSGRSVDYAAARDIAINVALVGAALFASFLVLRLAVHWVQASLARRAIGRHWSMRITLLLVATVLDLLTVGLAWGAGYLIALQFVGGGTGRMGINQTLLLNAFLMVEMIKVAARALLQPRFPAFRLIGISDTTAAYWYFWIARMVSLIGYTFMLVAPILAANVSPGAAQAVRVLVMATAVVIGIIIVLQNKERVRRQLSHRSAAGRHDILARAGSAVARIWHIIAIFYLVALLVVWLINPREALPFMLAATVQSLIAIVVGFIVISFIGRFVNVGMRLPDDIRSRLPALESRLQAFVPRVMQVVRTVVLIVVVGIIAQAWGLVDFLGWLASDNGQRVTGSTFSAFIIVLVGFAIYLGVTSWVDYRLNPEFGTVPTAREKTLLSLFRNAFTIALVIMVTMLALAQIGVNIAPLLAGAGVLGLAIGFGAQKLVQDIITGVFIQLENVMNEGDVVTLGSTTGVVEKLTVRSVSIRDGTGTLHLMPFSSVDIISSKVKGFSQHIADIGVSYNENIPAVKQAMQDAFDKLMETDHKEVITGPLEMDGLVTFGDSAITVRARFKTLANRQWGPSRAYNELIKEIFDERGIEMPFPHVTLYMGADKKGKAPPLFVQKLGEEGKTPEVAPEEASFEEAGPSDVTDMTPAPEAKPVRKRPAKTKLLLPPST
jgi:small conductance mechanosensitive channel